jgi:Fic-DOC domain mobile mystery protein B
MIENDIPGATPLDPDEAQGLLHAHVTLKRQLDRLEQSNIQDGSNWLAKQRTPNLLSEEFVLKLHEKLFGNVWAWAGSFRRTEKNIGIDPIQIPIELRLLLDNTRYWIENSTYPPLEIAARVHHRLVEIHLFPNGNGRHARIYADAILTKMMDHDPIDWAAGEDLTVENDRRTAYIKALQEADKYNIAPLLEFVGLN